MTDISAAERPLLLLADGATVVVVGGGPAGAFFSVRILRRARELGKHLEVLYAVQS